MQSHWRPRGRCAGPCKEGRAGVAGGREAGWGHALPLRFPNIFPCKIFSHSARTTFSSGCLGLMMKGAEAWMGACHASQALLPRMLPLRFPDHVSVQDM